MLQIERGSHGVAAGGLAGAHVHASMRSAPSSWPDRGARVAFLGFAVAALHVGHGSPATRKATAPTRASEAVVHLALQENLGVLYMGKQSSSSQLRPATPDEGTTMTHHAAPLEGLPSSCPAVRTEQGGGVVHTAELVEP